MLKMNNVNAGFSAVSINEAGEESATLSANVFDDNINFNISNLKDADNLDEDFVEFKNKVLELADKIK